MEALDIQTIATHFVALRASIPLHPIRTQDEYDRAVAVLNALLDAGAANETHVLADLTATLGDLIADFEESNDSAPEVRGIHVLHFLMQQHQLKQSDLPEIGSQGVVSEILRGKRDLNVRQIKALSARFELPNHVFLAQ